MKVIHQIPAELKNPDLNETLGASAMRDFHIRAGTKLISGQWQALRRPVGSEVIRFVSSKNNDLYILSAIVIELDGSITETDRIESESPVELNGVVVTSGEKVWILSTNEILRIAKFVELN